MDLSKLSTEDLMALKAGRLQDVSTEGLVSLRGKQDTSDFSNVESGSSVPDKGQVERRAVFRAAAGLPEAALALGSGTLGSTIGGLAGLASLPFIGSGAGDVVRSVQNAMTYEPSTESGKAALGAVAYPFEKFGEGVRAVGDYFRGVGDTGKVGRYTAYGWGNRHETPQEQTARDAFATALETGIEAAPTLAGLLKYRPAPGAPTFNPRRQLAERRIEEAISQVPIDELRQGVASQGRAAGSGYFLFPSQALSREYPMLAALESEIRGSRAANAIEAQQRLAQQPRQAADLSTSIGLRTEPFNEAPVAAKQVADAARMSIGEIERTPNAMTRGMYAAAEQNPGLIPANRVNSMIADLRRIREANPGRTEIATQVDDLIGRINDQRLVIQGRMIGAAGRPLPLDSIPIPSNVAANISKSFSGEFTNLMETRPSLKGGVEAQVARMAEMLDREARAVSPELQRATDVQRAMRPQFEVGRFSPLDQASRATGAPLTFIDRVFGADKVDPAAFRSFADQIGRTDPNAIRDALGHYVAQARDRAFSTSASGTLNPTAGIDFANKLIGTPNKRQAFRTALEKAAEGRTDIPNPAAYADEIISMVELARDLSKQVGTMTGRASQTEIRGTDPIKAAAGQQLQSRSAITSMLISVWNKLSDNLVAETLLDPNSISRIMRLSTQAPKPQSMSLPLSLIGLQGGMQSMEGPR